MEGGHAERNEGCQRKKKRTKKERCMFVYYIIKILDFETSQKHV